MQPEILPKYTIKQVSERQVHVIYHMLVLGYIKTHTHKIMCVCMKENDEKVSKEQGKAMGDERGERRRGEELWEMCSPVYILSEKFKNNKIKLVEITMPFSA